MSIDALITDCMEKGILLWIEDDKLCFKAASGALTPQLKAQLQERRDEVINYLQQSRTTELRHDAAGRYSPFPLTDLQLAYLVGRSSHYQYGGVGCHSYIELALPKTDGIRLQNAWHKLIERHDMLRAVITADGQQYVQEKVIPPPVKEYDFTELNTEQTNIRLTELRDTLSHRCYDPAFWPLFDVRLSHIANGAILHFSIDLLIADFASIQVLLAELGEYYYHPEQSVEPLKLTFRDAMLAKRSAFDNPEYQTRYREHKQYWLDKLPELPGPPELPVMTNNSDGEQEVRFERRHFALTQERWQALCERAKQRKLTPSSVVLSAFTAVLARWSRHPEFCINLTLFNRPDAHPDLRSVVGDFIAVNVLGIRFDETDSFAQRTEKLQTQLWQDLEHSEFTGIDVLRAMSQRLGENILVPVVYTSTLGVKGEALPENDFMRNAHLNYGITQTPQVWLDCQTTERYGTLQLDWDIRSGVFPDGVIEAAFGTLMQLLNELADSDSLWLSTSPITLPAEMAQRHQQMNATERTFTPQFLHSGFCRQAIEQPHALAVIANDFTLNYGQLASWALSCKRRLLELGCWPNDRVAILMDKGAAQTAAVLSVLLSDATYVPIESHQPVARQHAILADAGIKLVITQSAYLEQEWPEGVTPLLLPSLDAPSENEEKANSEELSAVLQRLENEGELSANRLGYIIFTSGTTGRPKGVMLSHRAAWNTVGEINRRFDITPRDRVLGLASYSFDLSVWDFFGTLSAGACLVLPDPERRNSPEHWCQLIEKYRVSLWNSVPAQLQMLISWMEWESGLTLNSLRIALLSGDKIPVTLPQSVSERIPHVQLIGSGGPTETAIWCVWYPIISVDEKSSRIPYGVPLTNHQIHILNTHLEECPDNVPGEMYIGGLGLAEGYVSDEARTNERFITHPQSGQRLYKSGDIGLYNGDGLIEILGREDNQVKIRGYRIELGEIEAACTRLPGVKQAAAVVCPENNQLAVVLVGDGSSDLIESPECIEAIKTGLKDELLDYMLPEQIVVWDGLPLSANGKVDGKQIKQFFAQRQSRQEPGQLPNDSVVEQDLAEVWRDLLKRDTVYRNDDFFHIGGSSLSAINLLSTLLAKGYPATLELIFANPMFGDMVWALSVSHNSQNEWLDSICLDEIASRALTNLSEAQPLKANATFQNVLLTGASGYLGIYTLSQLLRKTDYTVYCLLRAKDSEDGFRRLRLAAGEKGVELPNLTERVVIFCGDMAQARLGLGESDYRQLAAQIDLIIHNASIINLMDPLSALFPTNVEGVANILSLASTVKVKPVSYISTIAVHHALDDSLQGAVAESTRIDNWRDIELTYEQSKIMAENLIYRARNEGIPINILRPATITWAQTELPFINDDAFLKFYRACLEISAYPRSSLLVNLVPVDFVARSVATIVRDAPLSNDNYHLVGEQSLEVEQIYGWFNELGCGLEALEFDDWMVRLEDNFVAGFVNIYFKQGMDNGGHRQYDCKNLKKVIEPAGYSVVSLGRDYFVPLIEYFNSLIEGREIGGNA